MEKIIQPTVWTSLYHGVTDEFEYEVLVNEKIDDIGLWRVVINGYPYKSLSELGVENLDEAFTATKQAIYCYLFENTLDDYEGIGEAGERTLNALRTIVTNAENSTEVQVQKTFDIEPESSEWLEDDSDKNYISKIYSINSNVNHTDYEISTYGNLPEGSKIVNLNGMETTSFSKNEKFKIMLLKEKLIEDGIFIININTELETKPVLYGAAPDSSLQNYALTAYTYENSSNQYHEIYHKIVKPEEPERTKIPEEPEEKQPLVPEKNIEEVKILPVTGM